MSKRLQVLMREDELKEIQRRSRSERKTVAEWVRESLRLRLQEPRSEPAEARAGRILGFAKYAGPTADIDDMLQEIERGRDAR